LCRRPWGGGFASGNTQDRFGYVTYLDPGVDVGAAYRDLRLRILDLVRDLSPEQWELTVPHCPDWTVRKLLAHLTGVVDDAINGNMAGVATPEWTQAQVDKRALLPGPDIASEWETWAPFVDARATEVGLPLSQLLFDSATHEHDLRYALAQPGARDTDAVKIAVSFLLNRYPARPGGSPIQVTVDGHQFIGANASSGPLLTASSFDILRAFGSRRTKAQVAALDWSSNPAQILDELPTFGFFDKSLDE
jgi:uncharacterized protein (TIGR03083 family)